MHGYIVLCMAIQRMVAGACAVAGVAVLAGPGWALLAAAVLIFAAPTPRGVQVAVARVRSAGLAGWRWLAGGGRRRVAATAMPAAMIAMLAGVWLLAGLGGGLVAFALWLGTMSLLVGWNTG